MRAYAKRKPQARKYVLAFRALVLSARWRRFGDIESQFAQVATIEPPDHVAFDFADEDLRVDTRVNFSLGLVRVLSVCPSANMKGKTK